MVIVAVVARVLVPAGEHGWRYVFLFGALGFLVLIPLRRLPESPRWLVSRGFHDAAERELRRIEKKVGRPAAPPSPESTPADPSPAEVGSTPFRGTLLRSTLLFSVIWICATAVTQTFTTWTPTILGLRGFTVKDSLGITAVILLGSAAGAFLAMFFADRFSRRGQLVGIAAVAGAAGLTFGLATGTAPIVVAGVLHGLAIGVIYPVLISTMAEAFPTGVRAQANGIVYGLGRVVSVVAPFTIAAMLVVLGTTAVGPFFLGAWLAILAAVALLGSRPSAGART